jgi:ComF family protein
MRALALLAPDLSAGTLAAPRCAACDAGVAADTPFCAACEATVQPIRRRDRCGVAGYVYGGAVARALVRMKSHREADLARPLGDLLWRALAPRADRLRSFVVVPVPLHPSRVAERGFNQSALLACRVARHLDAPFWPSALERTLATPPQTTLRRQARLSNVSVAFAVREPEHVGGRDVLLVDDVWTTGATLESCARTLLEAGAARVSRAVVARAGF